MEGKIKKLLLVTGAAMSSAVALLPLTSYAAQTVTGPITGVSDTGYAHGYACNDAQAGNECANDNGATVYTVNVHPTLALKVKGANEDCKVTDEACEVTDGSVVTMYPYTLVEDGRFGVELRSAMPYTVSLSAEEPSLVNVDDEAFSIRPRADIATGKNGWGVKKLNADKTPQDAYSAVGNQPTVFFDSGTNVSDDYSQVEFPFGVSVTDSIPQGTYRTEVTITAATKTN